LPPLKVIQYIHKYIFLIIKNKFNLLINKKSSKNNVLKDWVLEKFIFIWYNNAILMSEKRKGD